MWGKNKRWMVEILSYCQWIFGFHKRYRNLWTAERLTDSQNNIASWSLTFILINCWRFHKTFVCLVRQKGYYKTITKSGHAPLQAEAQVFQPATRTLLKPSRTKYPTHNEPRKNDRCGNTTAQLQAPDDGYINVRNMLSR